MVFSFKIKKDVVFDYGKIKIWFLILEKLRYGFCKWNERYVVYALYSSTESHEYIVFCLIIKDDPNRIQVLHIFLTHPIKLISLTVTFDRIVDFGKFY